MQKRKNPLQALDLQRVFLEEKLTRKDSNPDKQNQNLLCYRYTTGQNIRLYF